VCAIDAGVQIVERADPSTLAVESFYSDTRACS